MVAGELIRFEGPENWLDSATVHFKKAVELLPNLHRQQHVVDDFRSLVGEAKSNQDVSLEFSALLNISELKGATADDEVRMGNILAGQNRGDLALQHFFNAVEISKQHPRYLITFGETLMQQQRHPSALRQFERALKSLQTASENSHTNDDLESLKPLAELMKGIASVSYTHLTLPTICSV